MLCKLGVKLLGLFQRHRLYLLAGQHRRRAHSRTDSSPASYAASVIFEYAASTQEAFFRLVNIV